MANRKPTLYNLQNIPKTTKTVEVTCASCKKTFERKAGRVFICLFCGSSKSVQES